jgi:hypothetical protein
MRRTLPHTGKGTGKHQRVHELEMMAWPTNLSPFYPLDGRDLAGPQVLMAGILLLTITCAVVLGQKKGTSYFCRMSPCVSRREDLNPAWPSTCCPTLLGSDRPKSSSGCARGPAAPRRPRQPRSPPDAPVLVRGPGDSVLCVGPLDAVVAPGGPIPPRTATRPWLTQTTQHRLQVSVAMLPARGGARSARRGGGTLPREASRNFETGRSPRS